MHSVHTCAVVCSSRMSYMRVHVSVCVHSCIHAYVYDVRFTYIVRTSYIRVYMCLCVFISMRLCVRILVAMEIINVKLY